MYAADYDTQERTAGLGGSMILAIPGKGPDLIGLWIESGDPAYCRTSY